MVYPDQLAFRSISYSVR